jgi:uncharacterized protein
MQEADRPTVPAAPWWRHAHVWLVIAGPVIVVIAGFATLWLAIRTPDPVVQPSVASTRAYDALTPAQKARNLAATPAGEH